MDWLLSFFVPLIGKILDFFFSESHDFLCLSDVVDTKFDFFFKVFLETVWDMSVCSWNTVIVCIG